MVLTTARAVCPWKERIHRAGVLWEVANLFIFTPPEHSVELASIHSRNLFSFFSFRNHRSNARIRRQGLVIDSLEARMVGTLLYMPLVQHLDVCDRIQSSSRFEEEGVLVEHRFADNSSSMILSFEMRIRKTKEDLIKLQKRIR
jgi:hypothetical protein